MYRLQRPFGRERLRDPDVLLPSVGKRAMRPVSISPKSAQSRNNLLAAMSPADRALFRPHLQPAPAHEGFGGRVMRAMIRQANGEMRHDWHPDGIVCEIVLPI